MLIHVRYRPLAGINQRIFCSVDIWPPVESLTLVNTHIDQLAPKTLISVLILHVRQSDFYGGQRLKLTCKSSFCQPVVVTSNHCYLKTPFKNIYFYTRPKCEILTLGWYFVGVSVRPRPNPSTHLVLVILKFYLSQDRYKQRLALFICDLWPIITGPVRRQLFVTNYILTPNIHTCTLTPPW